jgi:hypothetical protein
MPGAQDPSPYNGHFESISNHPLFLFNQGGDRLATTLQPGNVHRPDGSITPCLSGAEDARSA